MLFDTGTLWSFAVVGRLDILAARFSGRAGWTSEVRAEIVHNAGRVPALQAVLSASWLNDPIEVRSVSGSDSLTLIRDVEIVRRSLAGASAHHRQNLGEAATIVSAMQMQAVVVTEDRDAAHACKFRGVAVVRTLDVLQEAVAMGDITCDEAWHVYQDMLTAGRKLPTDLTKQDLCYH